MALPVTNKTGKAKPSYDHIPTFDETYLYIGDDDDKLVEVLGEVNTRVLQINGGMYVGKTRLAKSVARKYGAKVNNSNGQALHLYMIKLKDCKTCHDFIDEVCYEYRRHEVTNGCDDSVSLTSLKRMLQSSGHSSLFILDHMNSLVEMNANECYVLGELLKCLVDLVEVTDVRFIITSSVRVCLSRIEGLVYEYPCNLMNPLFAGQLLRAVAGDVPGLDDAKVTEIVKLSKRIPFAIMLIGQKIKPSRSVRFSPDDILVLLKRSVTDTLKLQFAPTNDQIGKVMKNYYASLAAGEKMFLTKIQNTSISSENPLEVPHQATAELRHDTYNSLVDKSILFPVEDKDLESSSFVSNDMMHIHIQEDFLSYISRNINEFLQELIDQMNSFLRDLGYGKADLDKVISTRKHIRQPLWDAFYNVIILEKDAPRDERRGLHLQAIDAAVSFLKNGFRCCAFEYKKKALGMMTRLEDREEAEYLEVVAGVKGDEVGDEGMKGEENGGKQDKLDAEPVAKVSPVPINKTMEEVRPEQQQQPAKHVDEPQQKIKTCNSDEKVSPDYKIVKPPVQESTSDGEASPTRESVPILPSQGVCDEIKNDDDQNTGMRHFGSSSTTSDGSDVTKVQEDSLVKTPTPGEDKMRSYSSRSTVCDETVLTYQEIPLDNNSIGQPNHNRERFLGTDAPRSLKSTQSAGAVHPYPSSHPQEQVTNLDDRCKTVTSSIHSLRSKTPPAASIHSLRSKTPPTADSFHADAPRTGTQSSTSFLLSEDIGPDGQGYGNPTICATYPLKDRADDPDQSQNASFGFQQVGNKAPPGDIAEPTSQNGSFAIDPREFQNLERYNNHCGSPTETKDEPGPQPRDPFFGSQGSTLHGELGIHQPNEVHVPFSQNGHDPGHSSGGIPQSMYHDGDYKGPIPPRQGVLYQNQDIPYHGNSGFQQPLRPPSGFNVTSQQNMQMQGYTNTNHQIGYNVHPSQMSHPRHPYNQSQLVASYQQGPSEHERFIQRHAAAPYQQSYGDPSQQQVPMYRHDVAYQQEIPIERFHNPSQQPLPVETHARISNQPQPNQRYAAPYPQERFPLEHCAYPQQNASSQDVSSHGYGTYKHAIAPYQQNYGDPPQQQMPMYRNAVAHQQEVPNGRFHNPSQQPLPVETRDRISNQPQPNQRYAAPYPQEGPIHQLSASSQLQQDRFPRENYFVFPQQHVSSQDCPQQYVPPHGNDTSKPFSPNDNGYFSNPNTPSPREPQSPYPHQPTTPTQQHQTSSDHHQQVSAHRGTQQVMARPQLSQSYYKMPPSEYQFSPEQYPNGSTMCRYPPPKQNPTPIVSHASQTSSNGPAAPRPDPYQQMQMPRYSQHRVPSQQSPTLQMPRNGAETAQYIPNGGPNIPSK